MSESQENSNTPEVSVDDARRLLHWCRDHASADDALETLVELGTFLERPELAKDVLVAAEAVTAPVLAMEAPSPALNAAMVVLLSHLLEVPSERDAVDKLLAAWLRHQASFGDKPSPGAFQRAELVQRVGDMLGWGTLSLEKDREALGRFALWVNNWNLRHKYRARRALDLLRRNFPAPEIWNRVRFQ